jgi:hypothetical protein
MSALAEPAAGAVLCQDERIAAAISATVNADAIAIIPPITQASIPSIGVPAFLNTLDALKNIPEPITTPTTTVIASIRPISFFSPLGTFNSASTNFFASIKCFILSKLVLILITYINHIIACTLKTFI